MILRNWFPLVVTAAILIYGPSAARKAGSGEESAVRPAAMAAPAIDTGARVAGADAGVCDPDTAPGGVTCETPVDTAKVVADLYN
jgi:hypothetical protein